MKERAIIARINVDFIGRSANNQFVANPSYGHSKLVEISRGRIFQFPDQAAGSSIECKYAAGICKCRRRLVTRSAYDNLVTNKCDRTAEVVRIRRFYNRS